MKRIFCNKSLFLFVIMMSLGLVFMHFLFLNSYLLPNATHWILSFIKMLFFFYMIFIVSSILQIFSVIVFKVFPLKVFTVYPFTYDGKWRFHPIRLTYNIEGFSNSLVLNLSLFLNDSEELIVKLKKLLWIRKICLLITMLLMFLLFHDFHIAMLLFTT